MIAGAEDVADVTGGNAAIAIAADVTDGTNAAVAVGKNGKKTAFAVAVVKDGNNAAVAVASNQKKTSSAEDVF